MSEEENQIPSSHNERPAAGSPAEGSKVCTPLVRHGAKAAELTVEFHRLTRVWEKNLCPPEDTWHSSIHLRNPDSGHIELVSVESDDQEVHDSLSMKAKDLARFLGCWWRERLL